MRDRGDHAGCDSAAQPSLYDTLTSHEVGVLGEIIASCYLEERGYDILERNYRCPEGEADLVAYDRVEEQVVLVEVKTRRARNVRSAAELYPEEAVDDGKRCRYRRIAARYLTEHFPIFALRFDVVAITMVSGGEASIEHFYDVLNEEAER